MLDSFSINEFPRPRKTVPTFLSTSGVLRDGLCDIQRGGERGSNIFLHVTPLSIYTYMYFRQSVYEVEIINLEQSIGISLSTNCRITCSIGS